MAILDKLLGRKTMSERPTRVEVNCETGEQTVIELTDAEITANEAAAVQAEADRVAAEAEAAAVADAKASAQAKLSALGLTPEEIAALSK
jgi:uncharacterized protein (DUF2252 family)